MAFKFYTTKKRSALMQKIKSKNTIPEKVFAKELRKNRITFSRRNGKLIGRPDFILAKDKIAIFIDGEFWHGYNWSSKRHTIKANRSYWIPKIEKNIKRDKEANRKLKKNGWIILRFWESAIKKDIEGCIEKIRKTAKKSSK